MASMKEIKEQTIESVVKAGLCTGCGTCVGICPNEAAEMVVDHHKGIYVPQLNEEKCTECGLCFAVCPGHSVDFKRLSQEIFGKEASDIFMGNYLNCYIGHATDYDIWYNSASGGVVTALLIFALEEGLINGALVTKMREDRPLEPEPFVARTRQEIIDASKSKYCPVPANIALKEILKAKEGERFATVGLPCHIHGIRNAEAVNKKLKRKIVLHLGLFCNHAPSFLGTEYVLHKVKVGKQDVKRLDYRGQGWPGKMKIVSSDREIQISFPDYWRSGFGSFFYPERCTLCADMVSELSDISFGDAWIGELSPDKVGTSMLICRSEKGDELLKKALQRGTIEISSITRDKVAWSTREVSNLKKRLTARFFLFRHTGRPIPSYNIQLLKPGAKAYLDSLRCYLRIYLGRRRYLWGQLWILSRLSLLPKSIAAKILKVLGLYDMPV